MCVIRQNDKPLVEDLFLDLRDGEVLLSLLEILTAQQYVSNVCLASRWPLPTPAHECLLQKRERGRMRVHHINNVNTALHVLDSNGVKLVNISSNDIVDANPKLTLGECTPPRLRRPASFPPSPRCNRSVCAGLVWSIILHWQVHYHLKELMSELQQTNLEKTLLAWCRTHTQVSAASGARR